MNDACSQYFECDYSIIESHINSTSSIVHRIRNVRNVIYLNVITQHILNKRRKSYSRNNKKETNKFLVLSDICGQFSWHHFTVVTMAFMLVFTFFFFFFFCSLPSRFFMRQINFSSYNYELLRDHLSEISNGVYFPFRSARRKPVTNFMAIIQMFPYC